MFKLICRLPKWLGGGHKRGKFVANEQGSTGLEKRFQCPRCKTSWTRKIRKAKA